MKIIYTSLIVLSLSATGAMASDYVLDDALETRIKGQETVDYALGQQEVTEVNVDAHINNILVAFKVRDNAFFTFLDEGESLDVDEINLLATKINEMSDAARANIKIGIQTLHPIMVGDVKLLFLAIK